MSNPLGGLGPAPNMGIMAMMATAVPQPAVNLAVAPSESGGGDKDLGSCTSDTSKASPVNHHRRSGSLNPWPRKLSPQILTPADLSRTQDSDAIESGRSSGLSPALTGRRSSSNLPLPVSVFAPPSSASSSDRLPSSTQMRSNSSVTIDAGEQRTHGGPERSLSVPSNGHENTDNNGVSSCYENGEKTYL